MSNTYTVWGVNGATRLAMNQHHMAGVLGLRGGLGEARTWPPVEAEGVTTVTGYRRGEAQTMFEPFENQPVYISVLDVQEALHLLGYKGRDGQPLTLDGKWGPSTAAAFTAFRKAEWRKEYDPLFDEWYALNLRDSDPRSQDYKSRLRAITSYWDNIQDRVTAGVNATKVYLPFGKVRARLFRVARPETLPGTRPSRPGPRPPRPSTPGPDREEPRIVKKEETDWTTWILAGTGIAVAGVALWAVFFRKRRKG